MELEVVFKRDNNYPRADIRDAIVTSVTWVWEVECIGNILPSHMYIHWVARTYNGDLCPLPVNYYEQVLRNSWNTCKNK